MRCEASSSSTWPKLSAIYVTIISASHVSSPCFGAIALFSLWRSIRYASHEKLIEPNYEQNFPRVSRRDAPFIQLDAQRAGEFCSETDETMTRRFNRGRFQVNCLLHCFCKRNILSSLQYIFYRFIIENVIANLRTCIITNSDSWQHYHQERNFQGKIKYPVSFKGNQEKKRKRKKKKKMLS